MTAVALATLAVVVIIDQLSKWLAVATLPPREAVPVLGDWFRFLLVRNPGAAFSMGTDATIVLAFVQLIAVGVAVFLAFRARTGLSALTIGLIGGGAAGNLIDRISGSRAACTATSWTSSASGTSQSSTWRISPSPSG